MIPLANSQPPSATTPTQRRLADLAARLASANVDAAEYFAEILSHEAKARKRVKGFGLLIRFNSVTQKPEILLGE
jgi:hypothetical protein